MTPKTAYLVTHTSPDFDAIGSAWLLQRYGGLAHAEVVFVSFADLSPAVLGAAMAVLDIGGEHDPPRLRFDHHQHAALPSATKLVAIHLRGTGAISHIALLIELIDDGDRWGASSADSRLRGIHALLDDFKRTEPRPSDRAILDYGYSLLDALDRHLKRQAEALQKVRNALRWQSEDNLVVALEGADAMATEAAAEIGARLVVWASRNECEPPTYSMGCKRVGEGLPVHVGDVVQQAVDQFVSAAGARSIAPHIARAAATIGAELSSWFRHPQGFVSMRGTSKAPRYDAPNVDVVTLAQAISEAWQR